MYSIIDKYDQLGDLGLNIVSDAEFDRSDIIKVTGHRDTRSLDTYIGGASSSKKRALSETLAKLTCPEPKKNEYIISSSDKLQKSMPKSTQEENNHDTIIIDLDDNEQNEILNLDTDNMENDNDFEMNMIQTVNQIEKRESNRPYIFKNCTYHNASFK